jgi:phosphosulfolactate synthase (CoM biosynthesis protein A)
MARINIEIEDILWDMSDYEKQELVDDLYEDGFVAKKDIQNIDGEFNEFDSAVSKLIGNSWRLSTEDEETILRIANKTIL